MQKLKLKTIPDATKYPVLPPDMNYIYFEHAKLFSIQVNETNYSPGKTGLILGMCST